MGLNSGAFLKVELGKMEGDGNFMLNVAFASLLQEKDRPDATEEILFKSEYLGKLEVSGMITVVEFRERIFN